MELTPKYKPLKPDWFPGTAEDWDNYLFVIEMDQVGDFPQWEPFDVPMLRTDELRLYALEIEYQNMINQQRKTRERTDQLAQYVAKIHPSLAKYVIDFDT